MLRRTRSQIISKILSACKDGANITKVVYACNLNFKKAREFLSLLAEGGLVEVVQGDPLLYKTTIKGELALDYLGKLGELIPELGSGD